MISEFKEHYHKVFNEIKFSLNMGKSEMMTLIIVGYGSHSNKFCRKKKR